jgi:3alpha(or 20beta)-hydroxysteroid dehydrogenase
MGILDGSVALISGAARGQGEAIARIFAEEGASVVLGDILDDQGSRVAESLGASGTYVHLDVTQMESWRAAVSLALERFGKLTTLVNNAGIMLRGSIEEMSQADYEQVIAVNQVGCWLGMKVAAPAIRAAGGGAIVNTSSTAGLSGLLDRSAYVASKFAIRGMTKTAALEFGPDRIRVNCICPGAIATGMMSRQVDDDQFSTLPVPRVGRPEEVGRLAAFLASENSSYCTGAEFVIDGGMRAG